MPDIENEKIEIKLLLEAVYLKYGYDFRDYAKASIKRRIMRRLSLNKMDTISEMQHRLLYEEEFFETVLRDFSINVTEMFRDPSFYRAFREEVIPILREKPFIKIWHAGCSTGQEVYSLAIMLMEEGLYDKARIYATDFNPEVIEKAKEGVYPIGDLKEYINNYKSAGGLESFADYYTAKYNFVLLKQSLKRNILFSEHNLVTDSTFGEMDVVICRNVLIYFNRELQDRVFKLFIDSLCDDGVLCLGSKESIRMSKWGEDFDDIKKGVKIYRKRVSP